MRRYTLNVGDQACQSIFVGNKELVKIFQGDTLIWEKYLKMMLSLDPNGGSLKNNLSQYEITCDYEFPVVINNPVWTGHTFQEWNTSKFGTGTRLILTGVVPSDPPFGEDLTAFAKWSLNKYIVKAIAKPVNGGSATVSQTEADYQSQVEVNAIPSTGYHFTTWSDGSNLARHKITITDNVVLTATFDKNSYAITYDMAGHGTNPSANPTTALYEDIVTPIAPSNVADWNFLGWNPPYAIITGNTKFTAIWIGAVCTITYTVNCFGITPKITTKNRDTGVILNESNTVIGQNIISFTTQTGQKVMISTNASPDVDTIFVNPDGTVSKSTTYEYITNDVIIQITMALIAKTHNFSYIKDKIHTERFIQSSGSLIGGFKYKFHYNLEGQSADAGWGKIRIGHVGENNSHIMHLSFGYQVEGHGLQKIAFTYKADNANKIVGKKETGTVTELQVTGLDRSSTMVQIQDFIIDLTAYSTRTNIAIGIILRDDNNGCAGIYFGQINKETICTIEIVD